MAGDLTERKKWKQHLFNQKRKYLLCEHCGKPRREHGKRGKCLFDVTSFKPRPVDTLRGFWGGSRYVGTVTGRLSSAHPNISNIPRSGPWPTALSPKENVWHQLDTLSADLVVDGHRPVPPPRRGATFAANQFAPRPRARRG